MEDCQVLKMSDQIRERGGKLHILLEICIAHLERGRIERGCRLILFHLALFLNRLQNEGLLCTMLINDRTASLCQAGP